MNSNIFSNIEASNIFLHLSSQIITIIAILNPPEIIIVKGKEAVATCGLSLVIYIEFQGYLGL
jgi:hypothetical protein